MITRFSLLLLFVVAGTSARGDEPYLLAPAAIAARAKEAAKTLAAPIATVVDKPQPSPSGDAHDYISYARYYWPDPAKPDGKPFVSRDGQHNRAQVALGDHERLGRFARQVEVLAAAWHTRHDEAAARRAGEWLRAWLVTPATRMNPQLEFAQVRLGHDHDRGTQWGVLDARVLSQVVDALLMLRGSPALSATEEKAVATWFGTYLEWLMTSKNGRGEHAAKNNHGSWFLAQAIPIARYLGREELARRLCEEDKARIAAQFQPDGRQPDEIRRVDGLSYSGFNLEAQAQVARHAAALGIDLWRYEAPNGASLRRGLEFLRPYNAKPASWPTSQHAELRLGFLDAVIAEAERAEVRQDGN